MGSFNTTCSVSRLPIGMGDKVKLHFLAGNRFSSGVNCYINDQYSVYGLPLDAIYDDYGRYALVESQYNTDVLNMILSELKTSILEMDLGKNEYHDVAVHRDTLTYESLIEAIWESRAFIKFESNSVYELPTKVELNIMAVHEDVYKFCTRSFETYRGEYVLEDKVEQIKSHPHFKYYHNAEEFIKQYDLEYNSDDYDYEADPLGEEKMKAEMDLSMIVSMLKHGYTTTPRAYSESGCNIADSQIGNLVQFPLEIYSNYVTEIVESYIFGANLTRLNIEYKPIITSGQEYGFKNHIDFANMVIKLAEEKHKEHDSWDEEED